MSPNEEAETTKASNVVDMALTFTAMIRLFETGSKQRISDQLHKSFSKLSDVSSYQEYQSIHLEFCKWFETNIFTASKVLKNKAEKISRPASYGHAAKIFDIAVKVYVHYSNLPNSNAAATLLPFLRGAIDNPIMEFLKTKYPLAGIKAKTIEALGMAEYETLQRLIAKHIQEEFQGKILPVQYDDVMWHRLNRSGRNEDSLQTQRNQRLSASVQILEPTLN
ncbi:hypothetical protein [Pseudomonas putida]|uniref:Uncharacterized protein n=1 Tax=Pseudomonas putida TaxID=303 RepID=A0AAW4BZR2_PSEPU|nr:hypothetical protein [Pseudomonas putida]MBF8703965.1 hypothetical protein [Pseudomonas putida]MBF8738731.1 hypothetical protein [Pseudomonas putida]